MKVLYYNTRKDYLKQLGGDTIQLLKTKEYMEKSGVEITVSPTLDIDAEKYDIIHAFNVLPINPLHDFILKHRENRIVLSTIFWNPDEFQQKVLNKKSLKRKLYSVTNQIPVVNNIINQWLLNKLGFNTNESFKEKFRHCIESSKLILPNSEAEKRNMESELSVKFKSMVIPNAVDIHIQPASTEEIKKTYNIPDDFLLSVGRIEYRKNQAELLKAAKQIVIPVVFVVNINQPEKIYFKQLTNYRFIHIKKLTQPELFALYSIAKAHVMPSWFETPGLASLEAAFMGTQIVTTDRGCTKEYFREHAFYCSPDNPDSIEKAISESLNHPKDMRAMKKIIETNYTWEITAQKTLSAYQAIL
jgi:glycosyltransferase involved in cell wall biosynthesis